MIKFTPSPNSSQIEPYLLVPPTSCFLFLKNKAEFVLTQIILSVGHALYHGWCIRVILQIKFTLLLSVINNFLARAGTSCPSHHLAGIFAWLGRVQILCELPLPVWFYLHKPCCVQKPGLPHYYSPLLPLIIFPLLLIPGDPCGFREEVCWRCSIEARVLFTFLISAVVYCHLLPNNLLWWVWEVF